ncbi:MAG: VWA domain-containing protein, partial [Gemmataceae bacterium]|nr:VWA domain-containing protein [Gemmataceae bacterium]
AAHPLAGGTPVHGALAAGQTIVYVLDASGSMGEFGKFDLARKALAATLRRQPEAVRFQVVVYSGRAVVLLPAGSGRCVPATAQNAARMADALLAAGPPAGRSDHAEGLRKALELHPDVVVFLTDADGPPPTAFRGLLRTADPRPAVWVARVTPGEVARPAEWK